MDTKGEIANIYKAMEAEKGDLESRCETYAKWTIAGICPEDNSQDTNALSSYVVIGPRLVNSLSNKVVEAMFPHIRPFFTVSMSMEMKKRIRQEAGEEALAEISDQARKESRFIEDMAMDKLDLVAYRPVAVDAAQQLIVTGNSLLRRMPSGKRVVYGVKSFGIRRDIEGNPIEIVLKDPIALDELPDEVKEEIERTVPQARQTSIGQTTRTNPKPYTLYTRFWLDGKRWLQEQEVEGIKLNNRRGYSLRDFPCIALTWSLPRGYNYGRGLVEEHSNVFHNLDVSGEALFDIFQISADVRWIVSPNSLLDVVELNNSKRGSYHSGNIDDITALTNDKVKELGVLINAVERMERELSQVFLLGSGTVRDAERVTAYEVQLNALELENAFGGLYSRLAMEWQKQEAEYLVGQLNIPAIGNKEVFNVTITTGMESLSREGHLQNFRAAVMDLSMLNEVPEDIRGAINPIKVASFVFAQRGVSFEEFMFTQAELDQMQAQAQQAEQEAMNHEVAAQAAAQGE